MSINLSHVKAGTVHHNGLRVHFVEFVTDADSRRIIEGDAFVTAHRSVWLWEWVLAR